MKGYTRVWEEVKKKSRKMRIHASWNKAIGLVAGAVEESNRRVTSVCALRRGREV